MTKYISVNLPPDLHERLRLLKSIPEEPFHRVITKILEKSQENKMEIPPIA